MIEEGHDCIEGFAGEGKGGEVRLWRDKITLFGLRREGEGNGGL